MRIQAITEVNTNLQPNPYSSRSSGSGTTGKSISHISFAECLRTQIQENKTLAINSHAQWQAGSLLMGFYMLPGVTFRPEQKIKASAYDSPSDP